MTPSTARWSFFWPTALLGLCCVGALSGMAWLARGQAQAEAEAQVREALSYARSRLDAVIEASFSATANLESLLRVQGTLSESAFRITVTTMLGDQPQLRNVVVAPNDVVAMVHPLAANQQVLGLDYRTVPLQWAQIDRARHLRTPLIFAPVELVQGGLGLIQRRPVYLPGPDGEPRYWGSISAVADLQRFVLKAGLDGAPVRLALLERRADGQVGKLIWGDAGLASQPHLREDLELPGAVWSLVGSPQQGWAWAWWREPLLWTGAVMSLALLIFSGLLAQRRWLLMQRGQSLQTEVQARQASEQETAAAKARLEALLATASDWFWEQDADLRLSYLASSAEGNSLAQGLRPALGFRRWEQPGLVPGQPDEAAWAAHRAQVEAHQPFRNFEYAVELAQHGRRWISVSADPILDAHGRFCGYRGTGRDVTAVRELSQALSLTHDRLQTLLDSATQVGIIATDLDDRITDFNRGAEQILGYSAAEVLGSSPHRFHLPEEMAERARLLSDELGRVVTASEVFVLGGAENRAWTLQRRDGSTVEVSLRVSDLRDSQGQLFGHLGVVMDLTPERTAQEALRRTAQRLQAVMDSAEGVAIVTVSVEGRVELFNRGAELMLGCSAAQAIGHSPKRFHLASELEAAAQKISAELGRPVQWHEVFERQAAGLDGGNTRLWTYVRADDGKHRTVSHTFSALRGPLGQIGGYLAIARDVSEQLRAEAALRETKDRMQAVLDAALDVGIMVVDMKGRLQLFNKGAERLFGYTAEEVLGQPSLMLQDADELQLRARELSAELGRPAHRHEVFMHGLDVGDGSSFTRWTYRHKSGRRFLGALRLRRMQESEGHQAGFLAIAVDISAEVRAQEELERLNQELEQRVQRRTQELAQTQGELLRSERLAALGSLVAGVAHELNTPLGTCMTAASTLQERTQELNRDLRAGQLRRSTLEAYAEDSRSMAELLLRSLRNATDLVAHFKQLSVDQTSDNRRRFQLRTVVDDVLTVMRPQLKNSGLQIETDVQLEAAIDAYPGELGRLLSNLIVNAQLHGYEPGQEGRVRISARPLSGDRYSLVVADDGRGMSPEVQRRAFDPFFTTKLGSGGSGLGLNIVWNIATGVLGGSVRIESTPGAGTRFVFELPLTAPQRADDGSDLRPTAR